MANDDRGGKTLSPRVAEEIRALLARRRISGRQLASALNVSPSWVSYRLTGTQPIDLDDLERIADYLEVEVTDLIPARQTTRRPAPLGPFLESLAGREGRVIAPVPGHETPAFPAPPNGQAKATMPPGPKGPSRPADDKARVPAASRRPARVKSSARLAAA